MKYLLGYLRKSIAPNTEDAAASLGRQRAAIERVAENLKATVRFYDDLESGRYEANRPGWQALLAELAQNDPNCLGVAVEDYRATHRNLKEFLAFYDNALRPLGKRLIWAYFPNLNFDSADGRMMAGLLMGIAEWESRKSSERMSATIAYKVQKLHRHWGATPFGCSRDPQTKHLVPSTGFYWYNPTTREARPDDAEMPPPWEKRYFHDSLRATFDYYSNGGYSVAETGHALNLAGWLHWKQDCKTPKPFNRQTVQVTPHSGRHSAKSLPKIVNPPTLIS